jgi:hypothetical protein
MALCSTNQTVEINSGFREGLFKGEAKQMDHIYDLGRIASMMPIPLVAEKCTFVDAGPVLFAVEARQLTKAIIAEARSLSPTNEPTLIQTTNDFGASLHVLGREDGLEYLRFDCFRHNPHYHYIFQRKQENRICRFDDIAEGDPIDWTIARLRDRLPEMLEFAGEAELSNVTRSELPTIIRAVEEVVELLSIARRQAYRDQNSISGFDTN